MAIIKCKMCGGDLNITEGMSVAECEYCGTKQTVPNVDSEKKTSLFLRAEKLRRDCDFDRAAAIYDSIITDFPAEPEAYWGLLLCKYGIEYVDDPATGKKVPTCHRSSFDSVMEDENLDKVMDCADTVARKVYREEAKAIEEIRKSILEVSGKEPSYDIFICYKETDDTGERTVDSVLAQDVYDALTEKGYRVFFSRITLEDKLGTEYEPYIFAALNSAKIMLAFGTDYEYFNAVWVKNEWSRFLKLMARDKSKHLIPCYKDVDAYDLPKEFQKLQAQDLDKVGAVQDLLRGIEKLLPRKQGPTASQPAAAGGPTAESLLKRGQMFLEDKDWGNAQAYFDKVLDLDPECAEAYVGKFCANYGYRDISEMIVPYTRPEDAIIQEIIHLCIQDRGAQAAMLYWKLTGISLSDSNAEVYRIVHADKADLEEHSKTLAEKIRNSAQTKRSDSLKAFVPTKVTEDPLLEKALRFASPELRVQLEGYRTEAEQLYRKQQQEAEEMKQREEQCQRETQQRQQEEEQRRQKEEQRLRQQERDWKKTEKRRQQEEAEARNRAKKEDGRARYRTALRGEQDELKNELANLKGLFTGKRRREIEARLAEVEAELKRL